MLKFENAYEIVMNHAKKLGTISVDLSKALGRVLAEDILSDIDMPPFDKSAMDGYACRFEDLDNELEIIEEIQAGCLPVKTVGINECSKIMTGAVIPDGTNCVIIIEETELTKNGKVKYLKDLSDSTKELKSKCCKKDGENICRKSEDIAKGDIVLKAGMVLKPSHIAVLATVGSVKPLVYKRPYVGVIATGTELIEPYDKPYDAKIRNSNSYQLCAQIRSIGCEPKYYGIAEDSESVIEHVMAEALAENDVVLISGGVSMGDYDYVPFCMKQNGMKILFDRVAIQPGKPITFAVSENAACFGMPGNPVSTYMQFELLVKPFLFKIMGYDFKPLIFPMMLGENIIRERAVRESIIPVELKEGKVYPLAYHGSAHINALSVSDYVVSIPLGITEIKKGSFINVRQIQQTY